MLDEDTRRRIEAEAIGKEAARSWRLIEATMERLEPGWPGETPEAADLLWVVGPGPKLAWRIGEALYRATEDLVIEETLGRRRLIGPEGVLLDEPLLRPELN